MLNAEKSITPHEDVNGLREALRGGFCRLREAVIRDATNRNAVLFFTVIFVDARRRTTASSSSPAALFSVCVMRFNVSPFTFLASVRCKMQSLFQSVDGAMASITFSLQFPRNNKQTKKKKNHLCSTCHGRSEYKHHYCDFSYHLLYNLLLSYVVAADASTIISALFYEIFLK